MQIKSCTRLLRLLLLTLLAGSVWSCAATPVTPPEVHFYVNQEITYLKDSPGDAGNVLGLLHKGDKVELVEEGPEWWRVKVLRSGQLGWVRKGLLTAGSVPTRFYYVNADTVPLRECPGSDCLPLQILFRGEQVQKVAEESQGWWQVLVVKGRSLGWVPAAVLTEQYEETQQKPARIRYYYVAVARLKLLARPAPRSEVVRTLRFNTQVEKIGESGSWFKVRQPASGAVGWVQSYSLETLPLISPRGQAPARQEPKPFKQREEPLLEPEFM